ncbi:Fic family protein [Methanosphaerula palustris]|uniref:Filamentation induced by cAMP protein Fic n=1 Tax=Methanosphaerula palustris (strain ATCC BAA-1556 / DSM 19958 / E1-9c) TaxID=521011 RepID=B8GHU3_METPE|nr:Fic family protein [Methanosphaerula palustris]ACL16683.1 filamentation induced by cAMP protein Fic [Methanosphaerula palustris E1-9c]
MTRIPEKPPDEKELLATHYKEFMDLLQQYHNTGPEAGSIVVLVRKYNELEYIHWDDLRRKNLPVDPAIFWLLLKFLRSSQFRTIRIGPESFGFAVLERFQQALHLVDKSSPATFDGFMGMPPSETAKQQYLIDSLMEEAIASSRLEGAATTRDVAKKFLREGKQPRTNGERMIWNNYLTITWLQEIRDKPLTPALIREIHEEITRGTLEETADETEFRESNEILVKDRADQTVVYHDPPDFNQIPPMIDDLCRFANDEETFVHPIVKAIVIHFLIGYIHPFNDGNGRMARALFYWFVLKHRYDLFEYLSISRLFLDAPAQYTRAYLFAETDGNDMTYFIDFNLRTIGRALDSLRKYIATKRQEEEASLRLVEELPGLSFRQAAILKEFITHPFQPFTVAEIAGTYHVALQTARHDLQTLERLGRVRSMRDGKRQVFLYQQRDQ